MTTKQKAKELKMHFNNCSMIDQLFLILLGLHLLSGAIGGFLYLLIIVVVSIK